MHLKRTISYSALPTWDAESGQESIVQMQPEVSEFDIQNESIARERINNIVKCNVAVACCTVASVEFRVDASVVLSDQLQSTNYTSE